MEKYVLQLVITSININQLHEEKNLLEKVMKKFNYNIFDEKIINFYDIQDELENIKDFLNRKYNINLCTESYLRIHKMKEDKDQQLMDHILVFKITFWIFK